MSNLPIRMDAGRLGGPKGKQMKTISVDFDGVLHPYTQGWVGYEPADEPPVPGAREFLQGLKAAGYRVVVSSCRVDTVDGMEGAMGWLMEHDLERFIDDVTWEKPAAVAYVDDRAVPFRGDWQRVIEDIDELVHHKVHGAAPAVPGAGDDEA